MTATRDRYSTIRSIRDAHESETAAWLALRRALAELNQLVRQVSAHADEGVELSRAINAAHCRLAARRGNGAPPTATV